MEKRAFRKLMSDLERRVHEEGKKNPSWLMGYLQGLGIRSLTGFQCAALIDLLLVPLEEKVIVSNNFTPASKQPEPDTKKETIVDSSSGKQEVEVPVFNPFKKTLTLR